MVKEYIVKEISDVIDLKRELSNKLREVNRNSDSGKDSQRLISQQEDKLFELQKIYDFIDKAEQYQNLEVFGMNYSSSDSSIYKNSSVNIIESERQALAIDLHLSIIQVLQQMAEKAKLAIQLVDTDPERAKDEIATIEKYLRDFMSKTHQEVMTVRSYRSNKGFSDNGTISESYRTPFHDVSSSGQDKINSLTNRERDVLRAIAKGMSNKEIGSTLDISERTVKNHVSNVFKKIDVMDRTQAALFAIRNNFIDVF